MKPNIGIPHQRLHLMVSDRFVDHLGTRVTLGSPRLYRAFIFIPKFVPTIFWLCSGFHDSSLGPLRDECSMNGVGRRDDRRGEIN